MKFSCEKLLLQNAVNTASRAVAAKSSIPALEGLLLTCGAESLTVSGYNMQTGIRTRFPVETAEEGELVVNARLIGEILRRLPDDVVTFTSDEKFLIHLSCGDADFDIMGLSAADFPELPEVEEKYAVQIAEKTLKAMIQQTSFAVSTNEARPVHMGSEKIEGGAFSFVAPGTALNEVERICEEIDDILTITLGQRHILFEVGETELICRRLEGEFLDYKNAIPRRNPINVVVDTKTMLQSLERVSVVISEKLKSPVRCLFEEDRVTMSAKTASGDAKDVCRIAGDGQGLEIGFNNRYLMDALRYAPADTVKMELNTGISPAIIVPTEGEENFLYMVLPVRLKAN